MQQGLGTDLLNIFVETKITFDFFVKDCHFLIVVVFVSLVDPC